MISGMSSLIELVELCPGITWFAVPLGSSPWRLRAFHKRSISHCSLALTAFISSAEGSWDIGRVLIDGICSNRGSGIGTGWIAGSGWC